MIQVFENFNITKKSYDENFYLRKQEYVVHVTVGKIALSSGFLSIYLLM